MRHGSVDLSRQLDKARADPNLPGRPRQVERIDGNAVTAAAGAWIERLKAKRLGLRGSNYLPDVDSHGCEHHLEFVHECRVDRPVSAFQKLASLCDPRARNGNQTLD